MAAALAAAAEESSCLAAAGQQQPLSPESLCSTTPSELLAASEGLSETCKSSSRPLCSPGMLTCSAMRMQQRALLRQSSRGARCRQAVSPGSFTRQASPGSFTQGVASGSYSSGQSMPSLCQQQPSGLQVHELQNLSQERAAQSHEQSRQQVLQALSRCRKARKAKAVGPQGGGQDQLSQVMLVQDAHQTMVPLSGTIASSVMGSDCTSHISN